MMYDVHHHFTILHTVSDVPLAWNISRLSNPQTCRNLQRPDLAKLLSFDSLAILAFCLDPKQHSRIA
jgi:hypothetical protein